MLRFTSALQVAAIPDEQLNDRFEVIMPTLTLSNTSSWLGGSASTYEDAEAAHQCGGVGGWLNKLTGSKYTPIVEEITFGTLCYKTNTRRIRTGWYNVPTDIESYKDVNITMFCSVGMLTQYYLETWKRLVFNPYGEYYNPGSIYKKNIEIYIEGIGSAPSFDLMMGGDATHSMHITLAGCFPYAQDAYKLGYSSDPKRLTITQRFKVDKVIIDMEKVGTGVLMDNIGTPTSLINNVVNLTSGLDTSDYNINNVHDAKAAARIVTKDW